MLSVKVYGQDHSPWVQTVLLGLHEKEIKHTLRTAPPFTVFRRWGIMMPAASINDADWQLESADILAQIGYESVTKEDMISISAAWRGVTHRADKPFQFFHAFSQSGDRSNFFLRRLAYNFLRSFAVLYFFLILKFAKATRLMPDPENYTDQFLHWERKLEKNQFLTGDSPNSLDMLLFGIIQCHCSIQVPPISALQNDPRLSRVRSWIGRMQQRFSNYPHLYSGVYFEPFSAAPIQATRFSQSVFWLGLISMIVAFPITLPGILFLAARIRRK